MSTVDQLQTNESDSISIGRQIDWVNIIKQWKSSDMTQSAYCKANRINYNQFIYQYGKLSARSKAVTKLLPVKISQPDHVTSPQNNFILHYPSGLKLHIPINAHPEAIKVLLNCLER